jgi:hypothetical protein
MGGQDCLVSSHHPAAHFEFSPPEPGSGSATVTVLHFQRGIFRGSGTLGFIVSTAANRESDRREMTV